MYNMFDCHLGTHWQNDTSDQVHHDLLGIKCLHLQILPDLDHALPATIGSREHRFASTSTICCKEKPRKKPCRTRI